MFEDIFIDFSNIWSFISKWLLIIEDEGLRVFDSSISKTYTKAIIWKLRIECEPDKLDDKNLNEKYFSNPLVMKMGIK
jgi:hypothetical protein